jgi:hypothetical protein
LLRRTGAAEREVSRLTRSQRRPRTVGSAETNPSPLAPG